MRHSRVWIWPSDIAFGHVSVFSRHWKKIFGPTVKLTGQPFVVVVVCCLSVTDVLWLNGAKYGLGCY